MSTDCVFDALAPGGVDCSGNGNCVNTTGSSTCLCDEGWLGIGDFALVSEDCDQFVIAIRALWGLCAALHGILFLAGLYNVRDSFMFRSTRESRLFIGGVTASALCISTTGILKVVDFETFVIGKDPLVTVIFSFGTLFFWSACIIFVKTLSEFYTRKMQMLYTSERKTIAFPLRFVFVCNVLGCLSPIGCLAAPDVCTLFGLSHYFLLAFLIIALGGYWNRYFSESFLQALMEVDNFAKKDGGGARGQGTNTDLGRLIGWVQFVKNQTTQLAIGNFLIAVIMAWPFMLRKASYQLAIAWISAPGLGFGGISVLNDSIRKRKAGSSKNSSKSGSIERLDSYTTSFNSKELVSTNVQRRESSESQEV